MGYNGINDIIIIGCLSNYSVCISTDFFQNKENKMLTSLDTFPRLLGYVILCKQDGDTRKGEQAQYIKGDGLLERGGCGTRTGKKGRVVLI